jgi:sialate O-acetylesterase
MKKTHFLLLLVVLGCFSMEAKVTVASVFSDKVLQRNVQIPIWGSADANEKITVQFHNQTQSTIADKSGKWMLHLQNESAGGPFVLKISGTNTIQINNVLVGEVWICSGQSNMEWTVGQSDNPEIEIPKANFPNIRHIKIPKEINSAPNSDFKSNGWQICSPKTVANFTGIGYFFAQKLQNELTIPIGIINASWGGTNIETWISREGFESSDEFKEMISQMSKVDLDALLKIKMELAQSRIEAIQKSKFSTEKLPFYKELNFDDSKWPELYQPKAWEEQSLANFDGIVWIRKHFTITKEQLNSKISIEIPAIDDNDITYVNGTQVGSTEGWDVKRVYSVPNSILKVGDNVIAIRIVDTGGGGGIYGKPEALNLQIRATQFPLSGTWKFQVESIRNTVNENEFPSLCYNAMIHPLIPFAFKGVLWYQGESNASRAYQYQKAFPLLINDWRSKWATEFPFYFVQLATFKTNGNSNEGCDWAELREAQTKTLSVKNTAMVITTDVGNPNDIHPRNKKEVGNRLAANALNYVYDKKQICTGPTFLSFKIENEKAVITFENLGSGLTTNDNSNSVTGFEVAGNDQVFYTAKAEISNGKVIVFADKVTHPVAIRFGWIGDASACNLFNEEGFPAVPFRTDNWKMSTEQSIYSLTVTK